MNNTPHKHPLIKPSMQLGPDAIHLLRCISKQHTGDLYTYDNARVQRNQFGGPAVDIDFDNLELLRGDHPDTYGTLIAKRIAPKAIAKRDFLLHQDQSVVEHEIGALLKRAYTEDTEAYWLLSHAALRSILFPAAYDGRKRIDAVRYFDKEGYKRHLGSSIWLKGLTAKDVYQFHLNCTAACPSNTLEKRIEIITPFLKPSTTA